VAWTVNGWIRGEYKKPIRSHVLSAGLTDAIPIQPQRGDRLAGNLSRLRRSTPDLPKPSAQNV